MILTTVLARAQRELGAVVADLLSAPGDAARMAGDLVAGLQSGPGVRAFAYLLVIFIVGAGLEWLYWIYAAPALRWLVAAEPRTRVETWRIAGRRTAIGLCAVLLSTLSILAAASAFAWPEGLLDVVLAATLAVGAVRTVSVIVRSLLSPDASRLRLVRARSPEARRATLLITLVAGVLAAGVALPDVIRADYPALAGAIAAATVIVAASLVVLAVALVERRRRPATETAATRRRRRILPRPLLAALWCAFILLMWLGGAPRWSVTIAIVSLTLVAEALSRRAVRSFWEAWRSDLAARNDADGSSGGLYEDLSLRIVRFLVALLGATGVAIVWDIPLVAMTGGDSASGRLILRMLGAIALLLVADLCWAAVRGAIDARLERIARTSPGDPETGANARLLTLLPLARKAFGVTLLLLVVLSVLSIFGIEITPLLAGAGVVGIAIGFGAQTLVRDVLSGVFYLAEDVFRIGDYIEGGSAKGTVERITLRTVALRHQNGPLHFVPYGSLGAVRNNSRDWVIDKFEIPLSPEVDSETVRKLIKSVGQKMLEDPEIAPLIVEPLKAKLYRIEPGVKVFRCKVQTPPGKQFEVRAACFKRIEAAFREAGIRYADSRQQLVFNTPASAPPGPQTASA